MGIIVKRELDGREDSGKLKLREFEYLYNSWKQNIFWVDYLLYAFLVWFEEKVLEARRAIEIDRAIDEYHQEMDLLFPNQPPIYSEQPTTQTGDAALLGGEMRLRAPFLEEDD